MIGSVLKLAVLLVPLLLEYLLPKEDENTYETKIKNFDAALAARDVDALTIAFNRMRVPQKPAGNGGDPFGPAGGGAG